MFVLMLLITNTFTLHHRDRDYGRFYTRGTVLRAFPPNPICH